MPDPFQAFPDIAVTGFVGAGRVGPLRGWRMHEHHHPHHHELVAVVSGDLEVDLDDARHHLAAGDCLYYAPGHPHTERAVGSRSFELTFVGWHGPPLPTPPDRALRPVHDRGGRIRQLLSWLAELAADDLRCTALAESLVREWWQLGIAGGDLEAVLRRHIAEHLREPLRVADLARIARCGERQLNRRCAAELGTTPRRLIETMRVDAARVLLASTDLGLDAIADQVGLVDAGQLSRAVKRVCGRPPGALRR